MPKHVLVVASHYRETLLVAFVAIFIALGIAPWYREDWLLENLLVFAGLAILVTTRESMRFSNVSYTLLFVFLVLHEVGAHYTYSLVPYDAWLTKLTGVSLSDRMGLERNHYDRVIHFMYGLCVLPPAMELLQRAASPKGAWRYVLPVTFIISHSAVYELIEWGAAVAFGGNLGAAYVGTQGDEWDSQSDMALAAVGAMLAAVAVAITSEAARRTRSSIGSSDSQPVELTQ